MRLGVLGGSSPFTIGLIDALASAPVAQLTTICLQGRDQEALEAVGGFARASLPDVEVCWTTATDAACEGSDIILHQIRYGGLEFRGRVEAAALAAGAFADETVGPAALATALAMRRPLAKVAECIVRTAPQAHVVTLTNPLGLAMCLLRDAGVADPIGICELPMVTAASARRAIGAAHDEYSWHYSGLNHRGFLHNLQVRGQDVLGLIAYAVDGDLKFGGVTAQEIIRLGGVPTKYFRMFRSGEAVSPPGRAETLTTLRTQIKQELLLRPGRRPPAVDDRDQPWWKEVVSLVHALASPQGERQILNIIRPSGIAEEGWCHVSRSGVEWIGSAQPGTAMERWLDRFRAHEQACLAAVRAPTPEALMKAASLDPSRAFEQTNTAGANSSY